MLGPFLHYLGSVVTGAVDTSKQVESLFKMSGYIIRSLVRTVFGLSAKIQPKQLKIKFEASKITHINVTSEQCGLASPKPSKMPCDSNAVWHEYKLK